jgi:hypothetical protein
MAIAISTFLILVFLFLGNIHFYWGLGGKWGVASTIPITKEGSKAMSPGLIACFIVGVGLLAVAAFIALKLNYFTLSVPSWIMNYGLLILACIFTLRAIGEFKYVGFFKRVKGTPFAKMDNLLFSPLCLLMAILLVVLNGLV